MPPTLVVLVGMIAVGNQETMSVRELVAAHTSAVELMHTLDIEIEMHWPNRPRPERWRWCKKGNRERLRTRNLNIAFGRNGILSDTLLDGKTVSSLSDWNPKNPPKIDPLNQGIVDTFMEPQTPYLPSMSASWVLMLDFRLTLKDDRRTLEHLVRDAPSRPVLPGAIVKGRVQLDGHQVWVLRVQHPGVIDRESRAPRNFLGSYMDIYLDPAVNFLARKVVRYMKDSSAGNGRDVTFILNRHAKRFRDFGNGVFFPMEVAQSTETEDGRTIPRGRFVVTRSEINQPLRDDAFDFEFPENAMVAEMPAEADWTKAVKSVAVHLIGPDGKPARTFRTSEELAAFKASLMKKREPEQSRRNYWLWVGLGVVPLLGLACFVWWRSRRKGR